MANTFQLHFSVQMLVLFLFTGPLILLLLVYFCLVTMSSFIYVYLTALVSDKSLDTLFHSCGASLCLYFVEASSMQKCNLETFYDWILNLCAFIKNYPLISFIVFVQVAVI